jgi:hypothetical protein
MTSATRAAIERAHVADIHAVSVSLGVTFKPAKVLASEHVAPCSCGLAKDDGFSVNTAEHAFSSAALRALAAT